MVGKYKVITLCGSTRFKDDFIEAQKQLTLEGNIVISVGLFGHSGDDEVWTEGTKEMLDDMHKRKIDMADEIFVINVGGYIGSSTKSEITYAEAAGKTVRYLENPRSRFIPDTNLEGAIEKQKKQETNHTHNTRKTAVVTGGAHGIGKAIADAFRRENAVVYIIDSSPGDWFMGDISNKETLEKFAEYVISNSGHINYLINNAPPLMKGIDQCSYEEFSRALAVGVTAPFYLTKLLKPYFAPGASVINISSSRDRMSQPQTESYTAAKGGFAALTHALAISLAGKARVNSISPGWIDTTGSEINGPDALQQPVGRVGKPEDIAELVLFLCSDKAGFITGENICIDGGMTKQMIYHDEHGWEYLKHPSEQ